MEVEQVFRRSRSTELVVEEEKWSGVKWRVKGKWSIVAGERKWRKLLELLDEE